MKTKIEIHVKKEFEDEFIRRFCQLMQITDMDSISFKKKIYRIRTHSDLKEKFFNAVKRRVLKEGGKIRNYDLIAATSNFTKVDVRNDLIKELQLEGRLIVTPYTAGQGISSFYFDIPTRYL